MHNKTSNEKKFPEYKHIIPFIPNINHYYTMFIFCAFPYQYPKNVVDWEVAKFAYEKRLQKPEGILYIDHRAGVVDGRAKKPIRRDELLKKGRMTLLTARRSTETALTDHTGC